MLVSRQCESEQNQWPFGKPAPSTRMSTHYEPPLSTQPDWPGSYPSFLPPGDNIFGQSYEHVSGSTDNAQQTASQPRSTVTENTAGGADNKSPINSNLPGLGDRRSFDPLGLRQKAPSPIQEQPEEKGDMYSHKASQSNQQEQRNASGEHHGLRLNTDSLMSAPTGGQGQDLLTTRLGANEGQGVKEEEDDGLDDEDMLDEGDEDGGDGSSQPQTAAERTAQRRKMKRFRLTHQQTRFLMSEFAKQPHPDAAHRERLSREIPGLSPRQVQVWFQNRRAKIKRLTADDRDRMIKMRAVPDDFDNVQALHSPYGAVHTLGTPISSPVDFSGSSYAEHMMRPLMVDVRRGDAADDHLSPTGLSPAFGSIGFNPSANMGNSDMLSPISSATGDRYGYPGQLSSPLSAAPRTSNPFNRQDASMQMHAHHQRQGIRSLQPLQLRETMSRSRSDSLQSPLRSSMSWKGDSIDYSTYHGPQSPHLPGRHSSIYQAGSDSIGTPSTMAGYDSSTYTGSTVHSPTHMTYPTFQSSSIQNSNQNRTNRIRSVSAAATMQPLSLDLRSSPYRPPGQGLAAQSPTAQTRTASTSHIGGSSSSYSASFPSAPLTAPVDFSLPRTPSYRSQTEFPQMSAPIAPPNDFSQAFQSIGGGAGRTSIRDGGSGTTLHPIGGGAGSQAVGSVVSPPNRSPEYTTSSDAALKRKQSFGTGAGATSGSAPYGTAN
ncbi:hypothetical protein PpBr36_02346 [Pyricularia pennisetigena]|uniref:hypothetical protein n=1 Tax=Pyricularia pennisetigena TaxID=1578925 RepID=UPI001154CC89|nr:hypothetical protein PpBr36_02346 [Pyricularia pennisetigena]TLS30215.1 hypothetical protein PpBr36_02346 [Pyricularia pennisetigena]